MPPRRKSGAGAGIAPAPLTPSHPPPIPMASSTAEPPITPAPSEPEGSSRTRTRTRGSTASSRGEAGVGSGIGADEAVFQSGGPGRAGVKRTRSGLLTPLTNGGPSRSPSSGDEEDELRLGVKTEPGDGSGAEPADQDVKPQISRRTSARMVVEVEKVRRGGQVKAEASNPASEDETDGVPLSKRAKIGAGAGAGTSGRSRAGEWRDRKHGAEGGGR